MGRAFVPGIWAREWIVRGNAVEISSQPAESRVQVLAKSCWSFSASAHGGDHGRD